MSDIEVKTETICKETFIISGKVLKLFKKWISNTKLSKQKIKILEMIDDKEYTSLETISEYLKISLPLLSYHINGNLNSDGLFKAEFIDKSNLKGGKVGIKLNNFGKLIIKVCKDHKNEF